MMTEEAIKAIETILARGNDVQIQRRRDGIKILEVNKKIRYQSPAGVDAGKGNQSQRA